MSMQYTEEAAFSTNSSEYVENSSNGSPVGSPLAQTMVPSLRIEDCVEVGIEMGEVEHHGHADIAVPSLISPRKKKPRAMFIDWIRSVSVYIVVIVHIFVSVQRVTHPSEIVQAKIEGSFRVVLQFGMPLFFYFSARSAAFQRTPLKKALMAKVKRLLLPGIVGFFLIVIPTCYVGRKYRPCASPGIDNFFDFYGNYLTHQIACNGLDWYWFLPVLFIISVMNQYYLSWLKERYETSRTSKAVNFKSSDAYALLYIVVLTGALLGGAAGIQMPLHLLLIGMAPYYVLFVLVLVASKLRRRVLIYLFYLAGPLSSLVLAALVRDDYQGGLFGAISGQVLMVFFYNIFYLEGFVDEVLDLDWKEWRDNAKTHSALKPVALLFMIVFLAIGSPTTANSGYIYVYPLYKAVWWECFFYVLGTWLSIALWLRYAQTFYDEVLNQFAYTHVTTSSMLVYLIHWFFIDSIQVLFVVPYNLTLVPALCVVFPGTALCCALVYVAILYIGKLIKKRRAPSSPLKSRDSAL